MRCLLSVLLAVPTLARAQAPTRTKAESVTGTYRLGPIRDYSCSLEAGPVAGDTLRLQLYCNLGPPTYNSGFIDDRVALPTGQPVLAFTPSGGTGPCIIHVRFAPSRAIVEQKGSALECGLGASVNMGGTYIRTSDRRPAFDLNPVK